MSLFRAVFLVDAVLTLLAFCPVSPAQTVKPVGGLDCNGHSKIQKPLRPQDVCADFHGEYGQRGFDNGHYVGHDEPSIGFISTVPHSGNNVQWEITLPRERPLPATQSFENFIAFWFAMALCGCTLLFGDFRGPDINNFGRDAQYGASNLYWFFGQNSGGPRSNPCIPNPGSSQN